MPTRNRNKSKRDEAELFQEVLDVGPLESLQAELIREISFLALTPFVGKRRPVETLLEAHRAYKEVLERHCQWLSQAFTELCAIVDRGRTVAEFYAKYGPVPHAKLDEALKALCVAYGRELRNQEQPETSQ
ncbi:MAG TPA: hypothetical protein PK349_11445 [Candidatus Hydrogenedentes bacterium]|nr:hypothetical protein [Candidatus Hydrogenedentota bacterium]